MRATTVLRRVVRVGVPTLLVAVLVTGCLEEGVCSGAGFVAPASASCAAGVEHGGHFYQQWSDRLPVRRGAPLGEAAYPGCDDTPACGEPQPPDSPTKVWRLRGADPDDVVVGRAQGTGRWVVFARPGVEPRDYFRFDGERWRVRRAGRRRSQEGLGAPGRA